MGYFGLRQPAIFTGRFTESPVSTPDIKKKYEKSTLSTEDSERISSRLNEMMSKEKLYLSSELSLPDLAQKLAVSTHHLSQMLNERIGKNFFEYINWLRVEEAKKLLKDENLNHLSIAGIAQEAGFYSLSAFNTIFKKSTGYTPSSYRKLPI
jgi:YesN/AraC family two-component response regulator